MLKACPKVSKKIEDDMRKKIKTNPGYGLGPRGKPNCTECVADTLEAGGLDLNNPWTPNGLNGQL